MDRGSISFNLIVLFSMIGFAYMGIQLVINPEKAKKRIFKGIGYSLYFVFLFIVSFAIYYLINSLG